MKLRPLVLLAMGALVPTSPNMLAATDGTVIPSPFPADRYASMIGRSPFSLATPKAEPVGPTFAANLYVAGIGKQGNIDVVSIASRDSKQRTFTLYGEGDSYQGIVLIGVQWADEVGASRVTIKKGGTTGSIGFNEQVIKSPISVTPPKAPSRANTSSASNRPGGVPLPRPNVNKSSSRATPPPRVRPRRTIRRPGQ